VLEAARTRFAAHGYESTRLRDVAADAGVDVALVSYFFASKDGLFAAAMDLAINPAELVAELVEHGTEGIGERLLRMFLAFWDDPTSGSPLVALVRSAASHDRAADLLRGFVERELLARLATAIAASDPAYRAALAGSQLIGVAMARNIVKVEPIASSDTDKLVAALAPTLQRYLTGDIGPTG
jgi:AcrR family transcriptional regulator